MTEAENGGESGRTGTQSMFVGMEHSFPGRKEDEAKETDGRMEDAAGPVEWDERLKRHKTWDKEGATENGSSIGP